MRRWFTAIVAALVLLIAGGRAEAGNILVNGSFEAPDVASTFTSSTCYAGALPSGWLTSGNVCVFHMTDSRWNPMNSSWPGSSDGPQYLYLGDSLAAAWVAQQVTFGAGSYQLGFDLASFETLDVWWGQQNHTEVKVEVMTSPSSSYLDLGTFTQSVGEGYARQTTAPFSVGTPGIYWLKLSSSDLHGTFIDNMQLDTATPDTPAAVPEPATIVLVGLGLAGIGARRRRR